MPTVDGVTVAPDAHGVIQGDGGAVDKLTGGSGNDKLEGHAAFNQYYGGAGDDTFILSAHFAESSGAAQGQSTAFADQYAYITDFAGAGVDGGDFLSLQGFAAGSLTLEHVGTSGTSGATLYYYSVVDAATGHTFNFMVNSLNGNALGAHDFNYV